MRLRLLLPPLLALALALPAAHIHAQGQTRLNDTGITWSGEYPSGNDTACNPADATRPDGQDCRHGRDDGAGSLTKMGGSTDNNGQPNGFDYSRICNSGQMAGQGGCPASPALGAGPNDWGCTRDNLTRLVWEIKVFNASHLRHQYHTYVNNTNTSALITPGGSCSSLSGCNTESYVAAVNAAGLCGGKDWRMPTVKELEGITDFGRSNPSIDPDYFPNTQSSSVVWSGSPVADDPYYAWYVDFSDGYAGNFYRYDDLGVRLVRAGQ